MRRNWLPVAGFFSELRAPTNGVYLPVGRQLRDRSGRIVRLDIHLATLAIGCRTSSKVNGSASKGSVGQGRTLFFARRAHPEGGGAATTTTTAGSTRSKRQARTAIRFPAVLGGP